MKRWFFTHFINYNTVSIHETAEYGPLQGYATEKEAIMAAIESLTKTMSELSAEMLSASKRQRALAHEQMKLIKRLNEI